ncbi:aromatic amino acid transaminase [Thaumasiovibrio subtropicus]|uniref:amino acid aminotransferase n=1 Tax=Thaumasiovibrio subtropicus TaxID=1891207 RepID=UPI000B362274|nr:amino acid aminotransferase [Thaumasiovibrio subtropicus]
MLSQLTPAPLDPILSLTMAFREDQRENKMDLGIGVYKDASGHTPIMAAVAQAQEKLIQIQDTKSYVGLAGNEVFNQAMMKLVLGEKSAAYARAAAVQTPGASGALRMLADLIKQARPNAVVWLSNPSYVNHQPVMEAAGLKVAFYDYFDSDKMQVNEAAMLASLEAATADDIVLLHGCCHNPTGADLSLEGWEAVAQLALKKGFTPFVDIAYQGFGDGIEADTQGIRLLAERVPELLIATSCSKSFGLYRERTGAAIIVGESLEASNVAKGRILQLARSTYTMPPDHGAAVVATILTDPQLTQIWEDELNAMQARLQRLRQGLVAAFQARGCQRFDFIVEHKGMFSHSGLAVSEIDRLREEFGIYIVGDGRINIAGMQEDKLTILAEAILSVI